MNDAPESDLRGVFLCLGLGLNLIKALDRSLADR